MITSKELQYVDSWASKIPMPGVEYSKEVLEEIKACYELFKQKYHDKEYNIIFSNQEEIKMQILDKNLCHMLGIDYSNIKDPFFKESRAKLFNVKTDNFSSFELLEMILENADKIAENDNNPKSREKFINYYKSSIKCEIFNKLSDFDKFNFGAINDEASKLLFMQSNEPVCPYFMMGIKPDEDDEARYIVSTLLAPDNPINNFRDKEVIIPTQIIICNSEEFKKLKATPSEKIKLLTMYKNIVNMYGIPYKININGDYEAMLGDLENKVYSKSR